MIDYLKILEDKLSDCIDLIISNNEKEAMLILGMVYQSVRDQIKVLEE